jgi:hypothetical protein
MPSIQRRCVLILVGGGVPGPLRLSATAYVLSIASDPVWPVVHSRYDAVVCVRTDFANLCNVGYAFINSVDATDMPVFYNAIHGRTWDVHNPDKVETGR